VKERFLIKTVAKLAGVVWPRTNDQGVGCLSGLAPMFTRPFLWFWR
jgi:hypothetical protein